MELEYGKEDKCDDDSGGSDALECNELETSEYVPHGLEYSDDEDILIDIDSDEEALRSLFPRDKSRKNMVPSGPEKPDILMCTESKGKILLQHYAKARKAFTDKQQTAHVKSEKSLSKSSLFTGKQNERLCTMVEVEKSGLIADQTFKSKDLPQLRISEEANLRGINTIAIRSDHTNLTVIGVNFYVNATFSEKVGWRVQTSIVGKVMPSSRSHQRISKMQQLRRKGK